MKFFFHCVRLFSLAIHLIYPLTVRGHTAEDKWAPDYIIIGAAKAGTTALHFMMQQHPQITRFPLHEIHFFDLQFDKGMEWYKKQFPAVDRKKLLVGEKSPYYIFHPWVPERVFTTCPSCKIIAILREPVSRAYSHYLMIYGKKGELSFEEALAMEEQWIDFATNEMLENPNFNHPKHRMHSWFSRGKYAEQLERWFQFFPREQILILTMDELKKDHQKTLNKIFEFLGLEHYPIPLIHRNKGFQGMPPINPKTKKMLEKRYEPYNRQLEELLGIKLNW